MGSGAPDGGAGGPDEGASIAPVRMCFAVSFSNSIPG